MPTEHPDGLGQDAQEDQPVLIVGEDRQLPNASTHEVVDRPSRLVSQRPCHRPTVAPGHPAAGGRPERSRNKSVAGPMRGLTPTLQRRVSSAPVANRILVVGWDGADWDILDPLLAAGELPHLARAHRARTARRVAVVHAVALLGGVADVPHRARPGRPRRLRHPRAPARRQPADARLVAVDPGPHLARAALAGRQARRHRERPAHVPRRPRERRRDRRRRDPAGSDVQPPGRRRARGWTGRSTAAPGRRSEQAGRARRGPRGRARPAARDDAAAPRRASSGTPPVSSSSRPTARSTACSSTSIPATPGRAGSCVSGRRAGARPLPTSRPRARVARSNARTTTTSSSSCPTTATSRAPARST